MKKNKLLSLLSTFSKEEMKSFEKFILSPFFNNGRNFNTMYKILKSYHPAFDSPELTEEIIFKKLNPGKSYDKKSAISLRVLESQMAGMAEKFLKYNNDNSGINEKFSGVNFLRVLNHRKLDSLFKSHLKLLEKSINIEMDSEHSLFHLKMKLEWEKCKFFLRRDKQQETCEYLLNQSEYFIYYTLIELFELDLNLKLNKNVFNADFKVKLFTEFMKNLNLENIMGYTKENSLEFYPVIAVYYNCLMATHDVNNESYYQNFKDLLANNIHLFSREEKFHLFSKMTDCCWHQMRKGNLNINEKSHYELFRIHKYLLETGLIKFEEKGFIRLSQFRNIIINALNVLEIDWLEKFINDYINELAPEHRRNMYNYGMAIVCFQRENFEKSLELISTVEYEYFYFKVDVKTWQLRIYYELNLFEQANSLVDTFKHFLSKNKSLSAEFRKPINEFLTYLIQLFKIKSGDNSISLRKIESEISDIPHLSHKGWLLRKINEIEKFDTKK